MTVPPTAPTMTAGSSRLRIRALKRRARRGAADGSASPALQAESQQIALALLDRSLRFRHRRLAILRLRAAAEVGAPVSAQHWAYCREILGECAQDVALRAAYQRAVEAATGRQPAAAVAATVPL